MGKSGLFVEGIYSNKCIATRSKCHATSNKCLTSSNKKNDPKKKHIFSVALSLSLGSFAKERVAHESLATDGSPGLQETRDYLKSLPMDEESRFEA